VPWSTTEGITAVTARVYIWYPEDGNVGHASMHIGSHTDPKGNQRYVSWWPESRASLIGTRRGESRCYNSDCRSEGSKENPKPPHVTYEIEGMAVDLIKAEWDVIRTKDGAKYRMLAKSCWTVVARVLIAGWAKTMMSTVDSILYGNDLYWPPRTLHQCATRSKPKAFRSTG
jgi:hypothetical protein